MAARVAAVRERLGRMCPGGKVSLMVAQRLVADSVYWYRHPHGPAKAEKFVEHITRGAYGWELPFGANAFLVGLATKGCCEAVERALAKTETTGTKASAPRLRAELELAVRGAVANHAGDQYPGFWNVSAGHMLFGVHSIHLGEFVNSVWALLRLELVTQA
ncbi:MAG: hypothetical protein J0L57_06005 [Burkholderiales bacterium]|nr:hypothetical protein [Burkholderiales bacterium]